jgi:hypothetical protein
MARRRFSIHNLVRAKPPLTPEQIADWWVNKNLGAIAEVAMKSMLDEPRTTYRIAPLQLVPFESSDARVLYQTSLHRAAKAKRGNAVHHAISQHIEDLALFCHEQLVAALSTWEVEATFQCDRFAYLFQREAR